MDHRHTLKGSSFSSSRWRHFPAKQTSVPQVMQGTGPNISISVVSSLQPGRYSDQSQFHQKKKKSSFSYFLMRGCTSHKKMWYTSSVCKDCHWVHQLAQSLFCLQYGLCQGHVLAPILSKFFLPNSVSRLGSRPWDQRPLLCTDHCRKFSLPFYGVASGKCDDERSHPGTHVLYPVLSRQL